MISFNGLKMFQQRFANRQCNLLHMYSFFDYNTADIKYEKHSVSIPDTLQFYDTSDTVELKYNS